MTAALRVVEMAVALAPVVAQSPAEPQEKIAVEQSLPGPETKTAFGKTLVLVVATVVVVVVVARADCLLPHPRSIQPRTPYKTYCYRHFAYHILDKTYDLPSFKCSRTS